MDPNAITYFGETDSRNKRIRFGIKAKDRLRHMYVIGKTGMGKSTLLENLAIQDIQNGEGLAFMDPHGGTAEKLLDYVPEHRIKDVLYFAPFDMEYPISFNVLEDIGPDKRHLVVNGLMATFEKIWVDAWSARMAYILSNTLLALLEYPGSTLLGVNRMLTDKEYRKRIVENIKDPSVKTFWVDEFGKWTEKFISEAIPAIQNKVGQFTANPLVRNLLGQPESSFDIRDFMDNKKILIINMSKGLVGEGNARLIGSMLITKIYLAAMSRADQSESQITKLPNFYLYVDEFQSFANKSFADILSEARKYKLSLSIAHQYIEQMEEEVRDAVFGNVGTMVTFRVGAFDAEVLEKEFAPIFTAEDLVNLGFAQIYLKLMIDGVSSQPFSATGLAPIPRPSVSFREQVIASSRAQFARPRADVEKNVMDWHLNNQIHNQSTISGGNQGNSHTSNNIGLKIPSVNNSTASAPNQNNGRGPERIQGNNFQNNQRQDVGYDQRPQDRGDNRNNFSRPTFQENRQQNQYSSPSQPSQRSNSIESVRTDEKTLEPQIDPNKLAFMEASKVLAQTKEEKIENTSGLSNENRQEKVQEKIQEKIIEKLTEKPKESLVSLSTLHDGVSKNPSLQNMSNLKNAIAEALKKAPVANPASSSVATNSRSFTSTPLPKFVSESVSVKENNIETKQIEKPISEIQHMPTPSHSHDSQQTQYQEKLVEKPIIKIEETPVEKIEDKKVEKEEKKQDPKIEPIISNFGPKTSSPYEIPEHVLKEILSMDEVVEEKK